MFTYRDIERALKVLDDLEGISFVPPLYERITCVTSTGDTAWMYLGLDLERYTSGQDPKVTNGIWLQE
jgi:hypothetical protein